MSCLDTIETLFWAHQIDIILRASDVSFRFCNGGDLPQAGLHSEILDVLVCPHRSFQLLRIPDRKSLVFHGKGMTDVEGKVTIWPEPPFRHTSLQLTAAEIFYLAIRTLPFDYCDRGRLLLALVSSYEQVIDSLPKSHPNGTAQGAKTTTIDPVATRSDAPALSCFTKPLFDNEALRPLVLRVKTAVLSAIFAFGRLDDLPLQEVPADKALSPLVVITPDKMEDVPKPQQPGTIWFCRDGLYDISGWKHPIMASTAIEVFFHAVNASEQLSSYSQAKLLRILLVQYERALTEGKPTKPEGKVIDWQVTVSLRELRLCPEVRMNLRQFWDFILGP